jgi:hypothetical protein
MPILIIAFNRPELLKNLLKSLKTYKPKKIYFACDGPRIGNKLDYEKCKKIKEIVETELSWECQVFKKIQNENIGVKLNINSALDWFFEEEEMGIIIEDDCDPSESFFYFCEELLTKYKDEKKVKIISGNYYHGNIIEKDSYYFSKCPGTHGWATWRRVWKENDKNMDSWNGKLEIFWLTKYLKYDFVKAHYFYKKFSDSFKGIIKSWDYQLLYSVWRKNGLIIRPYKSLCKHIGWGDDATHSKRPDQHPDVVIKNINFPMEHPKTFKVNDKLDNIEIKQTRNLYFWKYIFYKIKKKLFNKHHH